MHRFCLGFQISEVGYGSLQASSGLLVFSVLALSHTVSTALPDCPSASVLAGLVSGRTVAARIPKLAEDEDEWDPGPPSAVKPIFLRGSIKSTAEQEEMKGTKCESPTSPDGAVFAVDNCPCSPLP